jgi:hypothetical protein
MQVVAAGMIPPLMEMLRTGSASAKAKAAIGVNDLLEGAYRANNRSSGARSSGPSVLWSLGPQVPRSAGTTEDPTTAALVATGVIPALFELLRGYSPEGRELGLRAMDALSQAAMSSLPGTRNSTMAALVETGVIRTLVSALAVTSVSSAAAALRGDASAMDVVKATAAKMLGNLMVWDTANTAAALVREGAIPTLVEMLSGGSGAEAAERQAMAAKFVTNPVTFVRNCTGTLMESVRNCTGQCRGVWSTNRAHRCVKQSLVLA